MEISPISGLKVYLQNCNGNIFIYAKYIQLQTAEKGDV